MPKGEGDEGDAEAIAAIEAAKEVTNLLEKSSPRL
jgi:hypothetical protein